MDNPTPTKNNFSTLLFQLFILVFPLFIVPIFREPVEFPKYLLLWVVALFALTLYGVQVIRTRQLSLQISWMDLPIWLLLTTYLIAWMFNPLARWETWSLPNSIGTITALTLIYFFIRQIVTNINHKTILTPLTISANIIASVVIFQFINSILPNQLNPSNILAIFTNPIISLSGNMIYTVIFILLTTVLYYRHVIHNHPLTPKSIFFRVLPITIPLIAIIFGTINIINHHSLFPLQSYKNSWVVTAETYKQPQTLIYGIGPSKYELAYLKGRPQSVINTPVWNISFGQGANYWFTLATEIGLLGIAAFTLLVLRIVTLKQKPYELIVLLLVITFLPNQITLMFFLYISAMSLATLNNSVIRIPLGNTINPDSKIRITPLAIGAGSFFIFISIITFYYIGRIGLGEYYFTQSLQNSPTVQTRNSNLDQAISYNPTMSSYLVSRSQIQLAVAFALSKRQDLPAETKPDITQIIKASTDNAKAAIRIRPNRANWENLAQIYQSLIGADKQALQWTLSVYQNAIQTDPYNPILRLKTGQVLYQAQSYQSALQQFQNSRSLKKDFAAGWYWEGNTYKQLKNFELARSAYQQALALVQPETDEYKQISQDLETVQSQTSTPTIPPLPNQDQVNTPVNLPDDSGPNNLPALPTPTTTIPPTPTPNDSDNPTPTISPPVTHAEPTTLPTTTTAPSPTQTPTPTP